jgi:hypothetical protein
MINASLLDTYLGKHISAICNNGFASDSANHCAHFVSHVLSLSFGYCCGRNGANLRVHEIFSRCGSVEELRECRADYGSRLLFVTAERNVTIAAQTMVNVPKKHIGIVYGGLVWHYSNSRREVVKQVADTFIYHYKNQQNGLWLGTFPASAVARACNTVVPGTPVQP